MIKKILVTGANGYIGTKVVSELIHLGFNVIATDFSNNNLDPAVPFIKANIFDLENPYEFFGSPDTCIHLAWRDGFIHNSLKHIEDLSNHFTFISKLLKSEIKQISVMGTMHEIGYHIGKVCNDTPTNPRTLYGIAKDTLRKSIFLIDERNKVIWLRAFYIFGNDSSNPSVFGKLTQAERDKKQLFPINSGTSKFDFISIEDLSKQIALASTQVKYKGIINCCSGKPVSLGEKLQEYIDNYNYKIVLDYGKFPDRPYDSPEIFGDNTIIDEIVKEYSIK